MKTKALVIVLIAFVLVVLVVLIQPNAKISPDNAPINNPVETSMTNPQPLKQSYPSVKSNVASEPLPPGSNAQERLEEVARRKGIPLNVLTNQLLTEFSNAFNQELNRALDFYGKVSDENGSPLSGAMATISCLIYPEKQFMTNMPTDVHGLFELHGVTGQALTVSVAKDGYEEEPGTNEHDFAYYGVAKGFQPEPSNPIIFRLRKKASE